MPRIVRQLLVAVAAIAVMAGSAAAQDMTATDVTQLERSIDQISDDLLKLRQRDRSAARALQAQLSELEEDVVYLRVRLRREGRVPRAEYLDVRDRLDQLRNRVASGDAYAGRDELGTRPADPAADRRTTTTSPDARPATAPDTRTAATSPDTLPVGTELDVRLQTALSSARNQVEDRFEATTMVDLRQNGRVLIPAGSRVRGVVTTVREAGRIDRTGSMTLSFDQITVNGRTYPLRGTVTQALEAGGYREDAEKIGTGAAVGGLIGGILGGLRGALTGILIGGGGVVAATEGQNVELPPGTVLRVRLDQPLDLRDTPPR
jgi:hypothetical protein